MLMYLDFGHDRLLLFSAVFVFVGIVVHDVLAWDLRSPEMLRSVVWYLPFLGQPVGLIFKSHEVKGTSLAAWLLNRGPISCPETSVANYPSTLRKLPEEQDLIYTAAEACRHANTGLLFRITHFLKVSI